MQFFRPDLKLKKKRWHRLVIVLWVISVIFLMFICYWYVKEWYDEANYSGAYSCRRVEVGNLRDRLTNEVQDISDIIYEWEYIDVERRAKFDTGNLFHPTKWAAWCSNRWDKNNIEKLETISHTRFQNSRWSKYNSLSDYEEIESKLKIDPCVWLDIDGVFHYNQRGNYYILTMPCPEKSKVTMWWLLPKVWWSILFIVLYMGISIVIYYKGVIYIIYWWFDK